MLAHDVKLASNSGPIYIDSMQWPRVNAGPRKGLPAMASTKTQTLTYGVNQLQLRTRFNLTQAALATVSKCGSLSQPPVDILVVLQAHVL